MESSNYSISNYRLLISDQSLYDSWSSMIPSVANVQTLVDVALHSRLLCPVAPDSVSSYPFQDRDPFIISSAPDLVIIANCENSSKRTLEDTVIYCMCGFKSFGAFSVFNPAEKSFKTVNIMID